MHIQPKFTPAAQAARQREADRVRFLQFVQAEAEKVGPIGSVAYRKEAKRLIQGGRARGTQRLPITVERPNNRTRIVTVSR